MAHTSRLLQTWLCLRRHVMRYTSSCVMSVHRNGSTIRCVSSVCRGRSSGSGGISSGKRLMVYARSS